MGCVQSKTVQFAPPEPPPGDKTGVGTKEIYSSNDTSLASFESSAPKSGSLSAPIRSPPLTPPLGALEHEAVSQLPWKASPQTISTDVMEVLTALESGLRESINMPIALIGLMDSSKLWYRSSSGAFTPGVDRPGTFCQTLYEDCTTSCSIPHEFIVLNALEDPRFASHPSVVFRPAVRSYFGVPLLSVNGHCLGTLAALDTQVRAPPSTEQLALLRDTAARVVAAFQRGVIDRKEGEDPQASVVLPSLWIDVASSDWKVVGGNKEWEDLTGVLCDTLLDSPGLFSFMTPADDEELVALKKAVKTVDRTVSNSTVVSLPSIMTPIASNGSFLQFLFALKPAQTPPPGSNAPAAAEQQQQQQRSSTTTTTTSTISGPQSDIWVAEVHARIQSAPHTCPSLHSASISSGSVSVVDAGSGSAGGRSGSLSFSESGGGGGGGGGGNTTNTTNAATGVDGGAGAPPPARRSTDRPSSENRVVRSSGGNTSSGGAGRISNNDMRIPSRLMSLQIGQCLGRGSYGTVYAGMLRDRPVAVKVIENVTGGPGAAGQMWEAQFEALLALQKQHENVVPTLDWIKEDETGEVWIVQELCDLGTLASMFKEGVLRDARTGGPDMRAVLETACDVARGMRYLHSLNVLHSDLSSNNVMLSSVVGGDESESEEEKKKTMRSNSRGFIAKVTDFGLSRIAGREEVQTKTVGTVSHMPPELLMNGVMGKAGDVFSFGVMLWEMYSRKRAWNGSSMGQVIFAVTVKDVRLHLPEDAPSAFVKLMEECVLTEREARPTFDEIVPRIEQMLDELVTSS